MVVVVVLSELIFTYQIPYNEGLFIDYRWFDAKNIAPAFEFGFGLSYTTFTYANLQVQPTKDYVLSEADPVLYKIQADITNSGSVAGYEVPQLYIGMRQPCTLVLNFLILKFCSIPPSCSRAS